MRKFRIPAIPPTTNKTIRFPNNVIEEIEEAIVGLDSNFSAFVVGAARWALDNIDEGEIMPFYGKDWSRHRGTENPNKTAENDDSQDDSSLSRDVDAGQIADAQGNTDIQENPGQKEQ